MEKKTSTQDQEQDLPAQAAIAGADAEYAYDLVQRICTEVGPGLPGTPQERARAAVFQEEMAAHLGAANVELEEFSFAPGAPFGALRISALLMLLAALLNLALGRIGLAPWLTAGAALALSILSPLPHLLEAVLGLELLDPLFPKKQSVNAIGALRKPGTESVERLLILSGHHDSAPENTWLRLVGYGFLVLTAIHSLSFPAMLLICSIQLAGVIAGDPGLVRAGTLSWPLLAGLIVPSVLFALFFVRGAKGGGNVPGAVDNLSGSALAVATCRFLVGNPSCIPDATEIRFLSFGSEEAGLRGSRRYVARHLDELKRLDARVLNIEMVAHPEIGILTSDVNGTVKNSREMVETVAAAAERAGVPFKVKPAHLGIVTDAAPFSWAGLRATTLLPFKIPQQMVAFYHQKWDTPQVLTLEPLLHVLKLALEWVRSGGE